MATNGRNKPSGQSGKPKNPARPAGKGRAAPGPEVRTAVGNGPAKSAAKRESAAKRSGVDKTQLYIMGVAVVVIIAVIVFGFVLNNKNTAAQNEGYGSARSTVATVADGVITVSAAGSQTDAAVNIDVFEDPLCPFCGALERQFGQQMAQAMDEGKLTINYHLLTFLDGKAASPDYSTRAANALMCVAQNVGSEAGVYSRFHDQLFAEDVQPVEEGDTDLTNEQFIEQLTAARSAAQAARSPVPASESGFSTASQCILSGANNALVATQYAAASATLTTAIGQVSSPVVLSNATPINTDDVNWLTNLLAVPATTG